MSLGEINFSISWMYWGHFKNNLYYANSSLRLVMFPAMVARWFPTLLQHLNTHLYQRKIPLTVNARTQAQPAPMARARRNIYTRYAMRRFLEDFFSLLQRAWALIMTTVGTNSLQTHCICVCVRVCMCVCVCVCVCVYILILLTFNKIKGRLSLPETNNYE